jgi:hypothetical protein
MEIKINVQFKIGQSVYLRTDTDQEQRIVTGYMITRNDVLYDLVCGIVNSTHYGFEISTDKNPTCL